MKNDIIVVRGGGDIATGTIHKLYRCGFKVVILEIENPSSIRRAVCFSEAIYDEKSIVEGVVCEKANNIDEIYNYIKQILVYLKAKDPNKKLIIAIDSINDIVYNHRLKEGESVSSAIAKTVKSWTVEFDCPIFASTHMRKINANRRPVLDDLKDSTVLVYEASVTFIVYNDVSANKNNAKIFQQKLDSDEKEPILEIDWAKNKKSSYKGRTFCYFKPDYSKTLECNAEDMKRYSALIYEA